MTRPSDYWLTLARLSIIRRVINLLENSRCGVVNDVERFDKCLPALRDELYRRPRLKGLLKLR